jgi:rubrerythrin
MALRELHRSENDLGGELLQASDRHKVDHEIFYVARDIARWSQEHVRELARVGKDYGLDLDPEAEDDTTIIATVRQKSAELLGRHHDPALLLLADLRRIHRMAAGVSLDWEILAQTAQALKDRELLALAKDCHPQTLRQLRWANAQLKAQSAQVMVTA